MATTATIQTTQSTKKVIWRRTVPATQIRTLGKIRITWSGTEGRWCKSRGGWKLRMRYEAVKTN